PRFVALAPGRCEIAIRDRRRVHNHIGTVHAIALCNLAELSGGMLTDDSIPDSLRWIPRGMTVEYLAKHVAPCTPLPRRMRRRWRRLPVTPGRCGSACATTRARKCFARASTCGCRHGAGIDRSGGVRHVEQATVLARPLGLVERAVGGLDQGLVRRRAGAPQRDADAGADPRHHLAGG